MEALFASKTHDPLTASNLFDTYVQYKKDTRAIVAWLLNNGPREDIDKDHLSVRDLICIAETICAKAVQMPEIVAFHFRQAIAARRHLSQAFRRAEGSRADAPGTEDHEFFTSR